VLCAKSYKIKKNSPYRLEKKLAPAAAAAAAAMQRAVAGVVQISKHCVRISPRILTTDPRPRLQADAVSDLLSVSEVAICFLTHSIYTRAPAAAPCVQFI